MQHDSLIVKKSGRLHLDQAVKRDAIVAYSIHLSFHKKNFKKFLASVKESSCLLAIDLLQPVPGDSIEEEETSSSLNRVRRNLENRISKNETDFSLPHKNSRWLDWWSEDSQIANSCWVVLARVRALPEAEVPNWTQVLHGAFMCPHFVVQTTRRCTL